MAFNAHKNVFLFCFVLFEKETKLFETIAEEYRANRRYSIPDENFKSFRFIVKRNEFLFNFLFCFEQNDEKK